MHAYKAYNYVGITLKKKTRCIRLKFNNNRSEALALSSAMVNATFTHHLHGVVAELLVQVVGRASTRFACWHRHLDTGCFGTLRLPSGHREKRKHGYLNPE